MKIGVMRRGLQARKQVEQRPQHMDRYMLPAHKEPSTFPASQKLSLTSPLTANSQASIRLPDIRLISA